MQIVGNVLVSGVLPHDQTRNGIFQLLPIGRDNIYIISAIGLCSGSMQGLGTRLIPLIVKPSSFVRVKAF